MSDNREEIERGLAALRTRLPNASCPMCHGTSWSIGITVLQPVEGYAMRLLSLICAACAFTSLHDLDVLGVK